MTYALVFDGIIQSESGLPASARRLDTDDWLMPNGGLENATVAEQQACGYYEVAETPRPADTATDTYDRTLELVNDVPTVVWVQRPKTADEITADEEQANHSAIQTNLEQDQAEMQALIDTPNATINANPAGYLKDVARMNRRLGRLALDDLDGST